MGDILDRPDLDGLGQYEFGWHDKDSAGETAQRGIRVNATAPGATEAPPRLVPRNTSEQSEQEKIWYKQIYTQSIDSSLMKRYGSLDEQADPILFLASDDSGYITGTVIPVGGGDLG